MEEDKGPRLKPLLWGGFFILLGGLLLVQRFVGVDIADWWDLWPLVFLVIGTAHLVDRKPGSAATMYAFGFWFFAVEFGWFGMTFRNSWPLALIAVGIGAVIKAISGEESSRHEKRRLRIEHRRDPEDGERTWTMGIDDARRDDASAPNVRPEEPRCTRTAFPGGRCGPPSPASP